MSTDLFELLEKRNLKAFQTALTARPKLDEFNRKEQTLLHVAVTVKNLAFAESLLAAGASIDVKNGDGYSPLHSLIVESYEGLTQQNLAAANWLIDKGADVNDPGELQASTLHTAVLKGAQPELLARLIDAGADGKRKDHSGRTAFFLSMGSTPASVWSLLLQKSGSLDDTDEKGNTLLHAAVERHNAAAVKFLLKGGANPNARNNQGETPLDFANRFAKKLLPLLEGAQSKQS